MTVAVPNNSLSIVVPALDEGARLESVIAEIDTAAAAQFDEHEIIIVDDASSDDTAAVAARIAAANRRVQVLHLPQSHGLGGAFKQGLQRARLHYVTVAHGNGGTGAAELAKIWALRGSADIIVPYLENENERPASRLLVSRGFRWLVNFLFGIRVRYHLHYVLYELAALRSIDIRTDTHAFQAEALVKLLRRGSTYAEVGVRDRFEEQGPTRSYTWSHSVGVVTFLLWTLYDVYLTRRYRRGMRVDEIAA